MRKKLLGFAGVGLVAGGLVTGLMFQNSDDNVKPEIIQQEMILPEDIKLSEEFTQNYIDMDEVKDIQESFNSMTSYTFESNTIFGRVTVFKIDTCTWVYTKKMFYSTNCQCK